MSVAKIKKINIIGHQENKEQLLNDLYKLGVVEIFSSQTPSGNEGKFKEEIKNLQQTIAQLENLINYLEGFQEKKSLLDSLFSGKLVFNAKDAESLIKRNHYQNFIFNLTEKKNKIENSRNQIENNESIKESLLNWRNVSLDFSKLNLQQTGLILGMIDIEKYPFMEEDLNALSKLLSFKVVNKDEKFVYFSILFLKSAGDEINKKLKYYNVMEFNYSDIKKTIREEIESLEKDIKNLEQTIQTAQKEVIKEVSNLPEMQFFYDYLTNKLDKLQAQMSLSTTEKSYVFNGWIPEKEISKLKNIEKKYATLYITYEDPTEEEDVPTLMENKKSFKPFEIVTRLYSVPKYFEIDPTPFLAPFFAVTFALCLTDAGYGLFLLLVSLFALRKVKNDQNKEFLVLFSILGFFTFGLGIMAGSFFGIDFSQFTGSLAFLQEWHDKLAIIDPLKKPMLFFGLALGLGWVQLTFGFIIKWAVSIKEKDYSTTNDVSSWIVIMLSIAMLSINGLFIKEPKFQTLSLGVLGLGLLWLFLVAGKGTKNIFVRFAKGLYGLYDVISVLGDILSYARILALGLATAVIAGVANTLGGMVLGKITLPHAGIISITIFAIILLLKIVGFLLVTLGFHALNIAINTLGAFIHSVRLQFVEFFMKFYEGGGREFQPFKEKNKYTSIKD